MRTLLGRRFRSAQSGAAAGLLLLVVLVLGASYGLLNSLNTATAALQQRRDDATAAALRQAKEALIARAALDANRPGSLPCPDRVTNIAGNVPNDGNADLLSGNQCPAYVGRLPWRTLGLPDLRDSSGERLWYALSANFRDDDTAVINSDTPGDLTVQVLSPMANVVAIVFAPGEALGGQNRSGANVNAVAHYLEAENAGGVATTFVAAPRCVSADLAQCPLGPFNDQLMAITGTDLFDIVENVVARRIEDEVAPMLRDLRNRWASLIGRPMFPYAAPFDPAAGALCGNAGNGRGLLPASQCLVYDDADVTDTGTGDGSIDSYSCGVTPAGQPDSLRMIAVTCEIKYTRGTGGTPNARVFVEIDSAVKSLAVPMEASLIKFGNAAGAYTGGTPWGGITSQGLDSNGDLELTWRGNLPDLGAGQKTVTITFPVYSASTRFQQTAGVDTTWFFNNDWHRLTYFAVVGERLFNGSGSCTPGGNCFSVSTYPATGISRSALIPGPTDNKDALLVLAGRARNGVVRPSVSRADYLEGLNTDSPADFAFEQRTRSPAFNDKVVVVAPCVAPGPSPCP